MHLVDLCYPCLRYLVPVALPLVLAVWARGAESGAERGAVPMRKTTAGLIRGESTDEGGVKLHVFRGVPFAAPPVAELRWRPPQPVKPWEGTRDCVKFAPACPQPPDKVYAQSFKNQSEDCLYLNIWTGAAESSKKRPVMVWIHGGGNLIGGADSPFYDGRRLAAAGAVVVTIQYRLGPLGFLAHPALTAEAKAKEGAASSGNYGLLDQIAALQWVRENIAAFGGDSACVTVFGESAGAADITCLMTSPLAKGLFHRAIVESGYFGENMPRLEEPVGLRRSAQQLGIDFAERVGVMGQGPEALAALRALPPEKLLAVPTTIGGGGLRGTEDAFKFGPVVDGHVLPRDPGEAWAAGQMHKVPLVVGSNLDDGSVFSRNQPIRRLPGYRLALSGYFGPDAAKAAQVFPAAEDAEVPAAMHKLITIGAFRAPMRRLAGWMDEASGAAWLYQFSRNPGKGRARREGVYHGLEIGYVFGTLAHLGEKADEDLAAQMMRRWVAFARTGDPNGKGPASDAGPLWPMYHRKDDRHLDFGETVRAGEHLDRAACDLFDQAVGRRHPGHATTAPAGATP